MPGKKRITAGDVYMAARKRQLPVASAGQVKTASKAVLIGYLTGTEPVGVGEPGDGLRGGQAIADFLNGFYGFNRRAHLGAEGQILSALQRAAVE
jgi:hypothetical protein